MSYAAADTKPAAPAAKPAAPAPKAAASACVKSSGIKRDDAVTIVGFGSFVKKQRKARVGRNPLTGEAMAIKASRTVGFKASPTLKSDV